MDKITIEICCNSAADVFEAAKGGADRVELNSAMFLGGLTPSVGELLVARRAGIKIMSMVRPREGGFCYDDTDFEVMLADTHALLKAGTDGIVFGILKSDGTVDVPRCAQMMQEIGSAQSVFHRAIDVTPDWRAALDDLIKLGVTRVLTSGQAPSADRGADVIRAMREYAAGRIEILPGSGIRTHNIKDIIEKTGCGQVHLSMRKALSDRSCLGRPDIHFGGALYQPEDIFHMTDASAVEGIVKLTKILDRG